MDNNKLRLIIDSYLGTPSITGAHEKGAGVDCSTFPALVMQEMGFGPYEITYGYDSFWYTRKDGGDLVQPYLDRYCVEISKDELRTGDIVAYKFGYAVCHLSIVYDLEKNIVAHAHPQWGVEITEMNNACFEKHGKSRAVSYWRVKEEV